MPDALLTVGELAERAGLETSTIRYYDEIGLIRSVRTKGNQRRFAREMLRRLGVIRAGQRVGLTLDEIHVALSGLPESRTPTQADWERLSKRWQARLDQQILLLENLRNELSSCIGCGCLSFKACALFNPIDEAAELGSGAHFLYGRRVPVRPAP